MENTSIHKPEVIINIKDIEQINDEDMEQINDEDIRFNDFYKCLEKKALCLIVTAFLLVVILVFAHSIESGK